MRRLGSRLILMLLLIVFGIFFGVDMATKGTERIHGSLNVTEVTESSVDVPEHIDLERDKETEEPSIENHSDHVGESKQSKLPLWIGSTLQSIAHKGIEWIVSIFDWFI